MAEPESRTTHVILASSLGLIRHIGTSDIYALDWQAP